MRNGSGTHAPRARMPRWLLALIAPAAAVAIWSGWVGLGELCGFGPVHVLPGIAPRFVINTAICLPVGMEAYAGFALGVWLRDSGVPDRAKDFARWSAFGALALGVLGQITFHVLSSLHVQHAPIWVVVFVSCIPVGVLGLAAALAHLMSDSAETPKRTVSAASFTDAQTAALAFYEGTVAAGNPASQNKLITQFRLSRPEARDVIERGRGGLTHPAPVPAAHAPPGASSTDTDSRAPGGKGRGAVQGHGYGTPAPWDVPAAEQPPAAAGALNGQPHA